MITFARCLLFVLAVSQALAVRAETLTLVTEDSAPASMRGPDGKIVGIGTEMIAKALAEAGIPYRVSMQNWARAYEMALRDSDACVYSTSRTEEREASFKWIGPIIKDRWVLFGRADGPALASLEEARSHTIGGHYNGAPTLYLKSLGFKIDEVADFHSNLRRVAAHRLDFWAGGELGGSYAIAHDPEMAGIVPVLTLKDADLFLACNKAMPDPIVDRLNEIVKRMAEDGTAESIRQRYR